jgi:hypothetical protein
MAPAYLAAAAIALGHAIQIKSGFYAPAALGWLTVALACAALGAVGPRESPERRTLLTLILWAGVTWQLSVIAQAKPALYLETRNLRGFHVWAAIEAAVVLLGMAPSRWLRAAWFPALAAIHVGLGLWIIHWSPSPQIDVVTVHNAALRAIVHGHNPYAITFANIYGPDSAFYAPGAESGGRVLFGYPYPPLSLLMVVPGYLLGDYRYAQLAAIVLAASAMAYARPSQNARLAAALFLTTPRVFFVVEQGWSEPVSILLLSLTVFVMLNAERGDTWRRAGAVAAGLTSASKQYLILILPLLWKWFSARGAERRRLMAIAIAAAAALPLAFFLWQPRPFLKDVVLLQLREPFRSDALSYLVWLARNGWGTPSLMWTVAAMGTALAIILWRSDRSTAGVPASLAFVLLATFAFGRKAFCNYYFMVIGALCCAIAAATEPVMMANKRRSTHEPAVRPRP